MQIRLTNTDMEHVEVVQKHFSQLKPLPIDVATADVVRMGLRVLVTKLGREPAQRENVIEQKIREAQERSRVPLTAGDIPGESPPIR